MTKFDEALARRNAMKLSEIRFDLERELDHVKEDLADLREQLDAMTRERDEARQRTEARVHQCAEHQNEIVRLRAQLAEAKREAFVHGALWSNPEELASKAQRVAEWNYPAPSASAPEGTRDAPTLRDAALALYEAGRWSCDGLSESRQARLWEDLRDALGLPEGHATRFGVAPAPEPPQEVVVEVYVPTVGHDEVWERKRVRVTPEIVRQLLAMARAQEGRNA